ncbi:protein kinase [Mycobacterium kyorinense]|uniref:non-specific serine/threonine protein kinase n=1 Tax=Mycobacterium kyorinense TaxID=487514 RepID=A0A1A2ZGC1_9MYCO|nr:serine/threonine-protein kinase [Mycobacterium kyorinense]OBI48131.1 protein kinase [Mycobacterium kyorinense]
MASAEGSRIGTLFGPYELQALLGRGGMGEVYRAYDTGKDRTVALKLLRPELAADTTFQQRFRRESRLVARLQEPHVIPVHNFGEIDGVLYIEMRLVEGGNLKAMLRQSGALDPGRAVSIVAQVAAALDAAHADGLLHRDVKPQNVLLTRTDFAYLVDFGIARSTSDTSGTSAATLSGTYLYMAPERFSGGPVGPHADIYSLTCVLYECLTGQPPFPQGELDQLLGAHLLTPPPRPSQIRPDLGLAFDEVIARGMAKQPGERFPSAGELAQAANTAWVWSAGVPSSVAKRPDPSPTDPSLTPHQAASSRHRWPLLVAGAAAVLIAAVAGALWWGFGADRQPDVAVPPPARTTTTVQPPRSSSSTAAQPPLSLPGTDAQGFVDYPGARCDPGNRPTVLARTEESVLVICQAGPSRYYYRGVRLSDGAAIELANAVRSSGGFDVVNPVDGTRYEVRGDGLTIKLSDGRHFMEPIVDYAAD